MSEVISYQVFRESRAYPGDWLPYCGKSKEWNEAFHTAQEAMDKYPGLGVRIEHTVVSTNVVWQNDVTPDESYHYKRF